MVQASPETVNVLIASVGRRNTIVEWFREAAMHVGVNVRVIAADADPAAPALESGDLPLILPEFTSAAYLSVIERACATFDVHLLFSLNDYEIPVLRAWAAELPMTSHVVVAAPPMETLRVTRDKALTASVLASAGIATPPTIRGDHFMASCATLPSDTTARYVVKHRYGSGSSGLFRGPIEDVKPAIHLSARTAPNADGEKSPELDESLVVVQEMIAGDEYGLDIICDFEGQLQAVFARKKLRMRAGETERAILVDASPFQELASRLARTLRLSGITDVDVIVRPTGEQVVIDVNPRFGGGYPFSHLAGANVPAAYIAWRCGGVLKREWFSPQIGVVGGKYDSIRRICTSEAHHGH